MKKIISMLTVSALALGSIFADVSLEYTQKAYLYTLDGDKLQYTGYDNNKGDVKFTVKNDNAGILLDIDPKITQEEAKTVEFDQYTGWVNFGDGKYKLQSGVWTARSVNRFNGNAGKWKADEYEKYKYGVSKKDSIATDINNIASVNGTSYLSSAVTYNGDGFYATALLLGLDKTGGKATDGKRTGYGTLDLYSGFGVEAGIELGEGSKLTVNFKSPANKKIALGAFYENKTLKEDLDFVAGWSFGNDDATGYFETAIDLRASYALNEKVTLTTMNNLSYYSDTTQFDLWDMVSFGMKTSDKVLVMLTAEWEYKDFRHKNVNSGEHKGELELIPSVKYTATKGVDVSSGLIIKTTGWSEPSSAKFAIPFLLHVAL